MVTGGVGESGGGVVGSVGEFGAWGDGDGVASVGVDGGGGNGVAIDVEGDSAAGFT